VSAGGTNEPAHVARDQSTVLHNRFGGEADEGEKNASASRTIRPSDENDKWHHGHAQSAALLGSNSVII
jgi:hypothetical protein